MRWSMQNHLRLLGIASLAFSLAGCGGDANTASGADTTSGGTETIVEVERVDEPAGGAVAEAQMQPTEGNQVAGTVRFEETAEGLAVQVDLTGLPPGTTHGFHVHETGDCSAPDASSAGDHYNPEGHPHALPNGDHARHAGDMGNLEADENGEVHTRLVIDTMSVEGAQPSVIGRAVIVHADPDDGGQPTGNAGGRISCGVIEAVPAASSY